MEYWCNYCFNYGFCIEQYKCSSGLCKWLFFNVCYHANYRKYIAYGKYYSERSDKFLSRIFCNINGKFRIIFRIILFVDKWCNVK